MFCSWILLGDVTKTSQNWLIHCFCKPLYLLPRPAGHCSQWSWHAPATAYCQLRGAKLSNHHQSKYRGFCKSRILWILHLNTVPKLNVVRPWQVTEIPIYERIVFQTYRNFQGTYAGRVICFWEPWRSTCDWKGPKLPFDMENIPIFHQGFMDNRWCRIFLP